MCVFSTTEDNQTEVQIIILQGEREFAKDNRILGEFQLVGMPAAPRNMQKIQVSFDIDVNGILTVNAKDDTTGVETSIIIAGSSKLLDVDRDKILKDTEEFLKIDRIKKEEVDLKNEANSLIYQVNKWVEKIREKIDPINIFKVEESGIDKLITEITNDLKEENVQPIGLRKKLNVLIKIKKKLKEELC